MTPSLSSPAIGFHAIRQDVSLNFQMSRWFSRAGDVGDVGMSPLVQFHEQIMALTKSRSLTARLFTRAESARNHCQAGNGGLAFQVITAWLDAQAASVSPG